MSAGKEHSPHVTLARQTIEAFVKEGKTLKVPDNLPPEFLSKRAGVFVSLKKHGMLRGCIGTIEPWQSNMAEEIIYNAISASTRDPRFNPVEPSEVDELEISVDVLQESEPVSNLSTLDAKKYGVIVRHGMRSGLLLPDLEGVDTPQEQISIARQKAGIRSDEPVELFRFEVTRYY